jgi:hypothetical protein
MKDTVYFILVPKALTTYTMDFQDLKVRKLGPLSQVGGDVVQMIQHPLGVFLPFPAMGRHSVKEEAIKHAFGFGFSGLDHLSADLLIPIQQALLNLAIGYDGAAPVFSRHDLPRVLIE